MTPAARISAAIDVLDRIQSGVAAERALSNWARGNRYAGSKDRRAVRDHVYDTLRCLRSFAWRAGVDDLTLASGRQLMIGWAEAQAEADAARALFSGERFAPEPLSAEETAACRSLEGAPAPVALDCPDWLYPYVKTGLGADRDAALARMQQRAAVFVRVNVRKTTREAAIDQLAEEGVEAQAHALSPTALEITAGATKIARTQAYLDGLIELQDAGSQAICDMVPLSDGDRVLDYCAGGGGKSLALAARAQLDLVAHDIAPERMNDITPRAVRAGVDIALAVGEQPKGVFDVVVLDVPCSGSGTFARDPQAKWAMTPDRLAELTAIQSEILHKSAHYMKKDAILVYMTCSVIADENDKQIEQFILGNPEFSVTNSRQLHPLEGADGFYFATLARQ